jgi:hypothetical protein
MKGKCIQFSGDCQETANIAKNKVYIVPEKEKHLIDGEYTVQKQFDSKGQTMCKILSNCSQSFEIADPNVEDGYMCILNNI